MSLVHILRYPFLQTKGVAPPSLVPLLIPLRAGLISSRAAQTRFVSRRLSIHALQEPEPLLASQDRPLSYPAGSALHAVNSATKWAVTACVTTTVLARRDALTYWAVVGSVVAAALCKVLKKVINEQRPPNARAADPGMPSSHATSLSFLAVYTAAALALQPGTATLHQALSAAVMAAAAFLAWLRVHTGYHTALQTMAGLSLGSACALGWLWLFQNIVGAWCRRNPHNFLVVACLAAAAAAAFMLKMIRK